MDTLYALCRSVDNHHAPPIGPGSAEEIVAHKRAHFQREADTNPLVRAILGGGTVTYFGMERHDRHGLLKGPAGFFRTHEILRRTGRHNTPLRIDGAEYPHDEVAGFFDRCIPNAKLQHRPWFSPARYGATLGFAWALAIIAAHIAGRDADTGVIDGGTLYFLGLGGSVVALVVSTLVRNRDVRYASPWNSAMYLDLNADLIRRGSPLLAGARKEVLPRQQPVKTAAFYYRLAHRIEQHAFDGVVAAQLSAANAEPAQPAR